MAATSDEVTVRNVDGLRLAGTLDLPAGTPLGAVLLVHSGGVTREEGGFFTRLAAGLTDVGLMSLRVDLPGHGASEGQQEDLTLAALMNVIRSGLDDLRARTSETPVSVIAASFSGGAAAAYAARRTGELSSLVLLNPLLDYKQRFVDDKKAWTDDYISQDSGRQLLQQGYVGHSPTFKLGRPILNEVFWFAPRDLLGTITAPTLIVHGTKDTFIPVASSRRADAALRCKRQLKEIEGAQHGFAVHDDPAYAEPQTQIWQRSVITTISEWITAALPTTRD